MKSHKEARDWAKDLANKLKRAETEEEKNAIAKEYRRKRDSYLNNGSN